jgi:hypothetical protein
MEPTQYPAVTLRVEYPDRELNRVSTGLRIFVAIPIMIVLGTVSDATWSWTYNHSHAFGGVGGGVGGVVFLGPLLMIVFRQKYPRWWFDWNLELQRFITRVGVYLALMTDQYPATDEEQQVHLNYVYPDVPRDLNQWLPLVKWLFAVPHYIMLFFLDIGLIFTSIAAWFAIVLTGSYPRELFNYAEGVIRWHSRVVGYAFTLVTDEYPPFSLR